MASLFLFVKINGQWDANNVYKEKETIGILIPVRVTRLGLLQILYEELQLSPETHTLDLKYETDGGFAPVRISNDRSLLAYLELKKNEPDKTKFTLCVEISNQPKDNVVVQRSPPLKCVGKVDVVSPIKSVPLTCESVNEVIEHITPVNEDGGVGLLDICNEEMIFGIVGEECEVHRQDEAETQQIEGTKEDEGQQKFERSESASRQTSANKNSQSTNESCEVLDMHSPTLIKVNGMYANKKALQRHLQLFAIQNHFQFKVKTSKTGTLHVVCRDDNCKWTVRATKIRSTQLFQIKR